MTLISQDILATSFAGAIPLVKEMKKRNLPDLIDSTLTPNFTRVSQAKYSYSDMIMTWILSSICGAKRISNITDLQSDLESFSEFNIPSHDTIGRLMKKLAVNIEVENRKMNNQANDNFYDENMNQVTL